MKRTPLKSDPAKVAAFNERARENARERARELPRWVPGMPGYEPPPAPVAEPPRRRTVNTKSVPPLVRAEAFARSKGQCIMCVYEGRRRRASQAHHCFPKSKFPALIKVSANLVALCADCHSAHEGGSHRLPLAILPAETIALADGDGPMTSYLARTYRTENP